MRKPTGFLLWEDSKRACVLTGLNGSSNRKTGDMLQTWILVKSEDPVSAVKSGRDRLVCGNCPLRGSTCYVDKGRAPFAIWHCLQRGGYPYLAQKDYGSLKGRHIRFGAYGDPRYVPADIWYSLASVSDGWTGYTHQWRDPRAIELRQLVMASVDTPEQQIEATKLGWRTFRARRPENPKFNDEIICPASDEAGRKTTCEKCLLCSGTSTKAKNIVINAHGSGARKFGL